MDSIHWTPDIDASLSMPNGVIQMATRVLLWESLIMRVWRDDYVAMAGRASANDSQVVRSRFVRSRFGHFAAVISQDPSITFP